MSASLLLHLLRTSLCFHFHRPQRSRRFLRLQNSTETFCRSLKKKTWKETKIWGFFPHIMVTIWGNCYLMSSTAHQPPTSVKILWILQPLSLVSSTLHPPSSILHSLVSLLHFDANFMFFKSVFCSDLFFLPSVNYYTPSIAFTALTFFFSFFLTVHSLLSFSFFSFTIFLSTSLLLPVCHFSWNDASCCCSYFCCQPYKKKKIKKKKYSHLQKSSFQIHIMMSAGERSRVSFQQICDPVDTFFKLRARDFSVVDFFFLSFVGRGVTTRDRIHHRARRRGTANISSDALSCARVRKLLSD